MASATAAGSFSSARVVAAHDALQLGELADHAGDQVGLAQARRLLDLRRRRRPARTAAISPASASMRSTRSAWRAELGVEDDVLQRRQRGSSSRTLRSWSQKNLASDRRARSTRSLPATIVLPPSRGHDIGDDDEAVASAPSCLVGGEVALMRAHRDDQHLGRHVHELRRRWCRAAAPAIRPGPRPRPAGRRPARSADLGLGAELLARRPA